MAIGLAELVVQIGLPVSMLSYSRHDVGVHIEWDNKVISTKANLKEWLYKCSHVIWFGFDGTSLSAAKRFGCKNILVLNAEYATDKDKLCLNQFDIVICPSATVKTSLSHRWNSVKLHTVPWDPCTPLLVKEGRTSNNKIGVYVPIQSAAAEAYGPRIFYALQGLLDESPLLQLTIAHSKRWTSASALALEDLLERHAGRVEITKKPAYHQRMAAYATNDWTLYLHRNDGIGLVPLESLYNGTPVATLHTAPMAESIIHDHNGLLLPCDVQNNKLGIPLVANPSLKQLVEGLRPLADPAVLSRIRAVQWPELEARRRAFQVSWRFALDDLTTK